MKAIKQECENRIVSLGLTAAHILLHPPIRIYIHMLEMGEKRPFQCKKKVRIGISWFENEQ